MPISESKRYSGVAISIHWLSAVAFFLVLFRGWSMDDLHDSELAETLTYHVLGGMLVLTLLILRLNLRLAHPPPALPNSLSYHHRMAVHGVHAGIYVMLAVVPLTGLIAGAAHETPINLFGNLKLQSVLSALGGEDFDTRRGRHALAIYFLLLLILVHVTASLVHRFWFKDHLMERMLPGKDR